MKLVMMACAGRRSRTIPFDRSEALELVKKYPGIRGICEQCGCSEFNACSGLGPLEDENCAWSNAQQTLCTNPECLEKARNKKDSASTRCRAQGTVIHGRLPK
jgi:hypothetical protein